MAASFADCSRVPSAVYRKLPVEFVVFSFAAVVRGATIKWLGPEWIAQVEASPPTPEPPVMAVMGAVG